MTQANEKREPDRTVKQDDFRRDPGAAVQRAIDTGRVVITNNAGKTVVIISAPMDRLDVVGG